MRVVEAYEVQGLAFREMANEVFGYRKLIAYQKAKEVVKCAYKLLQKFPSEEKNAMCDQLRRATVAITSNISEGVSRYSMKEKSHFIEMSSGPLMEVSQLYTLLALCKRCDGGLLYCQYTQCRAGKVPLCDAFVLVQRQSKGSVKD